jgi:hypothetical protein
MRSILACCAVGLLSLAAWTQNAPPHFVLLVERNPEKLLRAVNRAGAESYRVAADAGESILMERTASDEVYQYAFTAGIGPPHDLREGLNAAGARGYRLLPGVGRVSHARNELLMEKAPGRPNQFQYVLADGHRIARRGIWIKDDYSAGPSVIAEAAGKGYRLVALVGFIVVLEKAAEATGQTVPCTQPKCYELRVVSDMRRHPETSLADAGQKGLRLMAGNPWATTSGSGGLVLMARDGDAHHYEYRAVPADQKRLAASLEAIGKEGFCAYSMFGKTLIAERSDTSPGCEYRVVFGDAASATEQLDKVGVEGFHPVLMRSEYHKGLKYTILAERTAAREAKR